MHHSPLTTHHYLSGRMPLSQDFSFGPFRLDAANARLSQGGRAIPLQPKAFDVLAYLLENAGRLVPQQELIDAVWPDTIVGDSSLKSCIRQIRQALGDEAKEPRYVETVHRRGYRFIGNAECGMRNAESDRDTPHSALRAPHSLLLVGRDGELAQLDGWLEQALAGQRQIVFVTGGPGSGKTTLVEALVRQVASRPDVWVASGQCFEQFGSGEAYLPVLEAIGQLTRAPGRQRLAQLLVQHAPTWLEQLPGLRQQWSGETIASGASPERMLREMAEVLETLTADTPLLLVLEDLHWGDYSTLDLISALARRRQRARLMVLATYRPVDVVLSNHPLRAVKQDLQARRLCQDVPLGLLSEGAIADYLAARFPGEQLPTGLAQRLHQRTEGNPLFLVNLVDYWLAQGMLMTLLTAPEDGAQRPDSRDQWSRFYTEDLRGLDVGVPASIRALIEKHLERLSPQDRLVLEAASIAGVEFSAASAAVAGELDVLDVETCCESLVRQHHFLQPKGISHWPDGTASARYRFGHELYHRVVYEHVAAIRRQRLHGRLAERLEEAFATKINDIAAELALHFEKAGDHARAVHYLSLAAERAARHFAHREAIDYLRRGLELAPRLPPGRRDAEELRLQLGLGLQLQATRGFAAADAQQAYARSRELCTQLGQADALFPALWGLWLYHKVRSELGTARQMAGELYALAEQRQDPALKLQSHQAFAVTTLCLGEPAATREHMEQGAILYDPRQHHALTFQFGQDPGVACLAFGAVALWLLGYPDQARQRSDDAVRFSHEQSQPSTQALALHFAAILHQCRRDWRSALACADLTLAIAADHGLSFWHAGAHVLRGWALAESGNPDEGIVLLRDGIDAWSATGSVTYRPYYLALLADALARSGRTDDALSTIDAALELASQTSEGMFEAELHRKRGGLMLAAAARARKAPRQVEEAYRQALAVAQRQQARSLALRAAIDLTRLLARQERQAEVLPLLAEIVGSMTEGPDTEDLQNARSLMVEYPGRATA